MSKKRPVRGSQPEEAYEGDLEDALMLDEPGTIVEPDVRKALLKYFRDMKMLEGTYLSRNTQTRVNTQQRESTVKITKRQLNRIIKEEQASLISEMPVSTARGYFSSDIETRRPELRRLADEIDSVFQDWDIVADVKMFDSGYQGVTMEFVGKDGSKNKWMVIDQPGIVGLEDQSTGYIFFGPVGSVRKENAWVWESPGRQTRRYGDVDINDYTRQRVYDRILEVIYDMLRGPMGSGTTMKEGNVKITEAQLRQIVRESSMIGATGNAEDERIHKVMDEMVDAINALNAASRMLSAQDPFERRIIDKLRQMQDDLERYFNELDERVE